MSLLKMVFLFNICAFGSNEKCIAISNNDHLLFKVFLQLTPEFKYYLAFKKYMLQLTQSKNGPLHSNTVSCISIVTYISHKI